jgi:hypothetical protein
LLASIDADIGVLHSWDHAVGRSFPTYLRSKTLRMAATIGVSGWF